MPDDDISPAAKIKGKRLEDIIDAFLRELKSQLKSHGIKSAYARMKHNPGRGKPNTDFLLFIKNTHGFFYYLYIESKNYNDRRLNQDDVEKKIIKKFKSLSDWEDEIKNGKNVGIVVGHLNMSKRDKSMLLQNQIHYLDTEELGYRPTPADLTLYDVFLRVKLLQFLALHTKGIFESFSSNYRLEIIDENRFRFLRNSSKLNFKIGQFENEDSLPIDQENLMNFFTIKKGKRGGNQLVSPWKGFTKNPNLSLRSTRYGTSLYKSSWGRKRK